MSSLGTQDLLDLYRTLQLTRGLEERLERLFERGQIVGGLDRSPGLEAIAVGSARALEPGDWLAPSIRNLGALLTRGLEPLEVFLQYTASAGSLCAGKDDTNHLTALERGLLGPISPLGTQLCVLNGMALSFRLGAEPHVCMTYLDDGATRTGASHEGLAFAAALQLPMVVVLEYDGWKFATRKHREAAVDRWSDIAGAYGARALEVDGNDVLAVYDAASESVAHARSGGGLQLIVAESYRMPGHARHHAQESVPESELETWREKDPLPRFERYVLEGGFVTPETLSRVRREVDAELDEAVDQALIDPMPSPQAARTRVYAEPEPDTTPWTRRPGPGYAALEMPDLAPAHGSD